MRVTHKEWVEQTGLNYPPDDIFSDDYYRFALSTIGLDDIRVTSETDENLTFWIVLMNGGCEVYRFTNDGRGVLRGYRKIDELVKNYTRPNLSKRFGSKRW